MVVGFTLTKYDGNSYYSPSFPRGGLAAIFAFDIMNIYGSPTFAVTVEHRDENETSWSTATTIGGMTAAQTYSGSATGIKQIVRFKYDFDAGDDATDAVHLLAQAPSWRPYA